MTLADYTGVSGTSLALSGSTPLVAWAVAEDIWVTRLSVDRAPLDLHGGLPGVDAYLGDPMNNCYFTSSEDPELAADPLTLAGKDGVPDVLYSVDCLDYNMGATYHLRGARFGL